MSMQQQARASMMRQHQVMRNRQQSMLERSVEEIGMENENQYQGLKSERNGGSMS